MASAADTDLVTVSLSHTLQYDDNLFRLPPNSNVVIIPGKSNRDETINVSTLGIRLFKEYSLQRFSLNASLVDYRYQNFGFLNFEARNHSAAWNWKLTPSVSGDISTERKQSAAGFADYRIFGARNTRTTESDRFNASWNFMGGWSVGAGVSEERLFQTQTVIEEPDFRLRSAHSDLVYRFPSGSDVALTIRSGTGDYPTRPVNLLTLTDNRFEQSEQELRLNWVASGASTIRARIFQISRSHPNVPARDFSGMGGRLDWNWRPTGKLSVNVGGGRAISAWLASVGSYRVVDSVSIGPVWGISTKVSARLTGTYTIIDYRGTGPNQVSPRRNDKIHLVQAAVDWAPYRNLVVSASLQSDQRASNQPNLDYRSTSAFLTAQVSF